jgi:putative ABC transport system permease protein
MFKNYIKTAFRSLKKNKGFTIINILGLALGLCVCMLIIFYVIDEIGYDRYNTKADRIYRVNNDIKFGGNANSYAVAAAPFAAACMNDFPEVETVVRFRDRGHFKVRKGDENVLEHEFIYSDPQVFDVFTLPMLHGDPKTALKNPKSVVITESIAKKYFNTDDAVGKSLTLNDTLYYKVTGVIKDMPKQSHFTVKFFLAMTDLEESKEDSWLSNNFNTYILLKPGANVDKLKAKFPAMSRKYLGGQLETAMHMSYDNFEKAGNYFRIGLTPLKDIHLHSNLQAELSGNGSIQYVYMFSAIAIFILLIACVNFMNLSTARSSNRAREVGVRKVLGSPRKYLIAQFLAESLIVTFIATVIAVIGARLLLPLFNQMADKQLTLNAATFIWLAPVLLVTVVVIGFLAGSYPAFFLSAFNPVDVLKGKLASGFKGGYLRSFLVVFQFSISIFLIIGTLVIYHQLKYIQSKDIGYNREQVLVINNVDALGNQATVLKEELKRLPDVVNTTMTGYVPTNGWRNSTTFFQDASLDTKKAISSQIWSVDEDYINTMGMKMLAGRNFLKGAKTDSSAIIINEAAVKLLGIANPIDKELFYPLDHLGKNLKKIRIIGVIKDFNFNSLRENVSPLMLSLEESRGSIAMRIKPANTTALLEQVKQKWHSVAPNEQFDYSFVNEDFEHTYRTEQRMGNIFVVFTTMAIVIACLGLFGLAAYAAEQRTKEIGIRKVLGANVSIIVSMLSVDFIKLVLISIVIASPLAWLSMQQWLKGFAYRDGIQWWVVVVAGAGAIIIAFVTISFQSITAALANPVKSLKSE